ncbi:MAG: coniferyl-alcohol dehydrogenase [Myxococcota bacterium]
MKNSLSYEGKRALITGCYSGMGEAAARIISGLGGRVVAVDIKRPSFDCESFHEVDLRDPDAIDAMLAEVQRGGPIDALFYCAGLPGGSFPALDVMLVNFLGLRHTVERCLPQMKPGSAIVSISSAAGMAYAGALDRVRPLLETPDHAAGRRWVEENLAQPGFEPYSFSKMCTIIYTLRGGVTITKERGVRINCISPGPTATPMMDHFEKQMGKEFMQRYPDPIGRYATPEEQAWPMVFLNSSLASHISGENLFTDGGTAGGLMMGALDPSTMFPPATPAQN